MGKGELTFPIFLININLMNKIFSFYSMHKKNCYFVTGIILSCLFMIPFLVLGTGSIITYHDQLDGELFSYLLTARYLFTDIRIYPEIMNGLPAAGAVPPAPLFVLFYVFLKPFTAFLLSQWIIYLVAFIGMYLLLLKLTGQEFISFGISVIFMLLPFYPVYGLCIPGQPLLCYAILSLSTSTGSRWKNHLLILFYGVSSSLVLVGFACLLLTGLFAIWKSIAAFRAHKKVPLSPWASLCVLLSAYLVTNLGLIRQVLFPENTYVSHKTEMVLSPQDFSGYFREAFGTGISYAQSYHMILFFLIVLCLLLSFLRFVAKKNTPDFRDFFSPCLKAAGILLFIFVVCLFYAFYHGSFVTDIRNASNGLLKTFNLDRICWLLPTAWCVLAGYLLAFLTESGREAATDSRLKAAPTYGCVFVILGIWGFTVLLHSSLRPNLSKLWKGDAYYALDWDSFFAEDIFSQIDEAIGKSQESYRVVSVGIYPAAAAYNGFYCLDGYSNNYPLEYKHTFRRIMEGELSKNDYVRYLFDNWGNRCYITTAEQTNYYTFEKKWNSVIYDLDLNTDQLKELNCQYVFSAAYLMNAEEMGLTLLREAPFETEKSWYHIYVYAVE